MAPPKPRRWGPCQRNPNHPKFQKMPGLVQECEEWITNFNLPNVFEENLIKLQWKKAVKRKILEENEKDLKIKMLNYSKLKNSELIHEKLGMKSYLKNVIS